MNLPAILSCLGKKENRPIFHSEADFQFALCQQIAATHRDAKIRLERCMQVDEIRYELDIFVVRGNTKYAIELKYKTKSFEGSINHERYSLTNQNASNLGRFDYFDDLERVGKFVRADLASIGYAIFLSNHSVFWRGKGQGAISEQFNIAEGREVEVRDEMSWVRNPSRGSVGAGRFERTIVSPVTTRFQWKDFSSFGNNEGRGQVFKFLCTKVGTQNPEVM